MPNYIVFIYICTPFALHYREIHFYLRENHDQSIKLMYKKFSQGSKQLILWHSHLRFLHLEGQFP